MFSLAISPRLREFTKNRIRINSAYNSHSLRVGNRLFHCWRGCQWYAHTDSKVSVQNFLKQDRNKKSLDLSTNKLTCQKSKFQSCKSKHYLVWKLFECQISYKIQFGSAFCKVRQYKLYVHWNSALIQEQRIFGMGIHMYNNDR